MLVLSQGFRSFLETRFVANSADHAIAVAWLSYVPKPDGDNYFDAVEYLGTMRISYSTPRKLQNRIGDAIFARGGHRVVGRVGSIAQRITGVTNGHALDTFAQALTAHFTPLDNSRFEVLSGDAIPEHYRPSEYCRCSMTSGYYGGPALSCATTQDNVDQGRFAIYAQTAEFLIVKCKTCDKIEGRTIIWTDFEKRGRFYDELYGSTSRIQEMQTYLGLNQILPVSEHNIVVAYNPPIAEWPQLDSMRYHCRTCCTISTKKCPLVKAGARGSRWSYGESFEHGEEHPVFHREGLVGGNDNGAAEEHEETVRS